MDDLMKQAATLATICQEQSAFLAESVSKPVGTPRVLTEKEMELDEYFRKYGTNSK